MKVSPQTLCASKTALSPFLEWEMVPSGFSPPGLLRFLPQFFHHRCCAAARWWGRVGWSDFFCCHPRSCQGWFGLVMQLLYTSDQEIYRYKRQCTLLYIITITSIINFLRKRVQNKSTPQKEQKAAETILKTEP